MQPFNDTWKNGAGLFGVIANGNHVVVKRAAFKFLKNTLRLLEGPSFMTIEIGHIILSQPDRRNQAVHRRLHSPELVQYINVFSDHCRPTSGVLIFSFALCALLKSALQQAIDLLRISHAERFVKQVSQRSYIRGSQSLVKKSTR